MTMTCIPREVILSPDLSRGAKVLYAVLAALSDQDRDHPWEAHPPKRLLAEQVGCSMPTLHRYMAELVEAGLILKMPRLDGLAQVSNLYRLLVPAA